MLPSTDNAFLVFNYNSWGVSVMEDEGGLSDHLSGLASTDGALFLALCINALSHSMLAVDGQAVRPSERPPELPGLHRGWVGQLED